MDIKKTVRNIALAVTATAALAVGISQWSKHATDREFNKLSQEQKTIVLKAKESGMQPRDVDLQALLFINCSEMIKESTQNIEYAQEKIKKASTANLSKAQLKRYFEVNKVDLADNINSLKSFKKRITLFKTTDIDLMIAALEKMLEEINNFEEK